MVDPEGHADVVVVGAGVLGALTALHVARLGRSVVVISDRHFSGATPMSTAILRTTCDQPELAAQSLAWYRAWNETRPPHLRALTAAPLHLLMPMSSQHAARIAAERAEATVDGAGGKPWNGRLPLDYDAGDALIYVEPESAYLDPGLLTLGIMVEVTRLGGRVLRMPAERLRRRGGRWMVHTPVGVHSAEQVVIAAGAGTRALLPEAWTIASSPLRLCVAVIRTRMVGEATIMDVAHDLLIRRHADGLLATLRDASGQDLPEVLASRLKRAPGLAEYYIEKPVHAFADVTADGLPLAGPIGDGLFVLAGFGSTGLKIAPTVTKALVRALVDGDLPSDIAAFDPLRAGGPDPGPLRALA